MKIHSILNYSQNLNSGLLNKKQPISLPDSNVSQNAKSAYNPMCYKDFGINFAGQICRSPENFYEQTFNRENMPFTMKEYLFEDYEDRQHMPPHQILKYVFNDLNSIGSLEEAKKNHPDEPLFDNLSNKPKVNAKTGLLAQIQSVQNDFDEIPLFKDGTSDIGLYTLKKIYLDGKILSEINQDFRNDVSDFYKDLFTEPIDYRLTGAYGIKFPKKPFWNSFVVTRDNWKYEYKPRNSSSRVVSQSGAPINSTHQDKDAVSTERVAKKPARFAKVKEWEVDKLADAMVKGNGSNTETKKQFNNRNIQNKEALGFVAQYMGEINSVVLEKLHISDDMKDYFQNYEDLTKTQREKFESYMRIPSIREQRSEEMKAVIKMFMDLSDDEEDFADLLEYARGIKAERIANLKAHELKQLEQEELWNSLMPLETSEEISNEPINEQAAKQQIAIDKNDSEETALEKLKNVCENIGAEHYEFETSKGTVALVFDKNNGFTDSLMKQTSLFPKAHSKRYANFVLNTISDKSFILSTVLRNAIGEIPEDDRLMNATRVDNIFFTMNSAYTSKYYRHSMAARYAIFDAIYSSAPDNTELFAAMLLDEFEMIEALDKFNEMDNGKLSRMVYGKKDLIEQQYNYYKKPLSFDEMNKISIVISDLFKNFNPNQKNLQLHSLDKDIDELFFLYSNEIKKHKDQRSEFKKEIFSFLKTYGGASRIFLNNSAPDDLKQAYLRSFLCELYRHDSEKVVRLIAKSANGNPSFLSKLEAIHLKHVNTRCNNM